MSTDGQLSPSDIAELADVSRAAVSNWRTRFADFPAPVAGSDARPLFDRAQVIGWLKSQGKPVRENDALQLWSAMNSFRGALELSELLVPVHLLMAERWFEESAPTSVAALIEKLTPAAIHPDRTAHWSAVVDQTRSALAPVVNGLTPSALLQASNLVLERVSAGEARGAGEHGLVGSRTSAILAAAARSHVVAPRASGGLVYDPACGIAEAAQLTAAEASDAPDLVGIEINQGIALIAAVRATLRGLRAQIHVADVLTIDPTPELLADIVVAEPPFGMHGASSASIADPRWRFGVPPRSSADFAWLQHVLFHLAPTGRGYVLTTHGPLSRGGQEGRIRAELLKHDVVRAVVALPGKLLPNTSVPLALWVVGSATDPSETGSVLVIDATDVDRPEDHLTKWLSRARVSAPNRRVSTAELLAGDSVLKPARWVGDVVEPPQRDAVESILRQWAEARAVLGRDVDIDVHERSRKPRIVRVQELLEHGTFAMWVGRRPLSESDGPSVVRPADLVAPLATVAALGTPEGERRTEPGDVLVARHSRLLARVDREGGHVVARGVTIIRPKPNQFDPDYLAGCMAAGWNEPLQPTGFGLSVKDIEIPVVPLDEQRRIGDQLRAIEAARDTAHRFEQLSAELTETLLRVVRHGMSEE